MKRDESIHNHKVSVRTCPSVWNYLEGRTATYISGMVFAREVFCIEAIDILQLSISFQFETICIYIYTYTHTYVYKQSVYELIGRVGGADVAAHVDDRT